MLTKIACGLLLGGVMLFGGCSKEKVPDRDHIPVIKARFLALQQAVKGRDRAAIDSLLSARILDRKQSSDSLLSFVYGPADEFPFGRFGDYTITYTDDRGRIDCVMLDTAEQRGRGLVLYLLQDGDQWLFSSFDTAKAEADAGAAPDSGRDDY